MRGAPRHGSVEEPPRRRREAEQEQAWREDDDGGDDDEVRRSHDVGKDKHRGNVCYDVLYMASRDSVNLAAHKLTLGVERRAGTCTSAPALLSLQIDVFAKLPVQYNFKLLHLLLAFLDGRLQYLDLFVQSGRVSLEVLDGPRLRDGQEDVSEFVSGMYEAVGRVIV